MRMERVGFVASGVIAGARGVKCASRRRNAQMVLSQERVTGPFAAAKSAVESPKRVSETEECDDGDLFGEESVELAIEAVRNGKMVLVTDDAGRENEGDLIMAADKITTEDVAFMVRYTSGVICASINGETAERLQLRPMVISNTDPKQTAFTVTCDYKHGTTTGISAADRALTLRSLADPECAATDFYRPGHVFPLRCKDGGVLERDGHTEAAMDLARMAGCAPVGVLVEVVNDTDGSMARRPYLEKFARANGLIMTSVADLIAYRKRHERQVDPVGSEPARLPTAFGLFDVRAFRSRNDGTEHLAVCKGGVDGAEDLLVRVEVENVVSHVFGDTGRYSIEHALAAIETDGSGCLVYIRKGTADRISSDLYSETRRQTGGAIQTAAQILTDLNVKSIRLMDNDAQTEAILANHGLMITQRTLLPFAN